MKVAYVHDWLITRAGAEKVLEEMVKTVKADEIFTLFYKRENFKNSPISQFKVIPSPLNGLPFVHKYYRSLLPLMPLAIEWFDLSGYELVISSSPLRCKERNNLTPPNPYMLLPYTHAVRLGPHTRTLKNIAPNL